MKTRLSDIKLLRSNRYIQHVQLYKKAMYSKPRQLKQAKIIRQYLEEHLEENLKLDVLANRLLISKFHLFRIFKKYYGLSPKQYLIEKRISKAKELLRFGLPVSEACYSVGFESTSSFSNLFKKITGFSPSKYQKKARFDK